MVHRVGQMPTSQEVYIAGIHPWAHPALKVKLLALHISLEVGFFLPKYYKDLTLGV